jgi:drug/metabolite transporter (DMT)-like permease
VAALLGVLLFREIPNLVSIVGILLVLSSIYLLSRR